MQTSTILYPHHWLYRGNVTDFNVQLNFSTQTQTHECRHAHTHTRTHARTHAHTHAHSTHTRTHTRTHAHTHARMHVRTHTHTHTHVHTHTSYISVTGVEGLGILCPESPCYEATKTPHSDTVGQVKYSDHYQAESASDTMDTTGIRHEQVKSIYGNFLVH